MNRTTERRWGRPASSDPAAQDGAAFAASTESYHGRGRTASRSRMLFAADGRPGGVLVQRPGGAELVKKTSAKKHQLRKPSAWALDEGVLREAEAGGATVVRVEDRDTGREFVASLSALREHGFPVRRGFGEQRGLELGFWRIEDPRQRSLFAEVSA